MPRHSQNSEKSPVDKDYEGLQLDDRARNPDKYLDDTKPQGMLDDDFDDHMNYINEKQAHGGLGFHPTENLTSPDPSYTAYGGTTLSPSTPDMNKPFDTRSGFASGPGSEKQERRICGLKRRHFWGLAGLTLGVILAGAIIGGVVGGLKARNKHHPPPAPPQQNNATQVPSFPQSQYGDVMVGSPLSVVSYDLGPSVSGSKRQAFRIYYQSLLGNIKEAVANGSTSWQSAVPIFTDALNNTGLAALTYLNGTNQQGSIFYVGSNGLLQEKRKIYNDDLYWEPGTINSLNLPMVGNLSLPSPEDDPTNSWDGYRMTAVYSKLFKSGPGARLFYHAQQMDGSSLVQEMIWLQSNDSWTQGATIKDVYPNSRLSATVDEKFGLVRLFYSSGNRTLQESYTSIATIGGNYSDGVRLPNFLSHNSADIASIYSNGTTYLYHYASPNQTANVGIHEITISGTPNSPINQESFNLSEPLVAQPSYPAGSNSSLYQPLAGSKTVVPGISDQLLVFWADKPTGEAGTNATGYGEMAQLSRPLTNSTWPTTGQIQVPLGADNTFPSSS